MAPPSKMADTVPGVWKKGRLQEVSGEETNRLMESLEELGRKTTVNRATRRILYFIKVIFLIFPQENSAQSRGPQI